MKQQRFMAKASAYHLIVTTRKVPVYSCSTQMSQTYFKRTDKIKTQTNIDFLEKRYVFITMRHCDGVSVLRDFGNVYVMRICIQDNILAR